jgi:cytidylate kinase
MNSLTFEQCLSDFQGECFRSIDFLTPFVLLAILFAVGVWSAWRNRAAFRRARRHGILAALALVTAAAVTMGWFYVFDPGSIHGVETPPMSQAVFVAAATAFGAGVLLSAGLMAYALGGALAKWIWGKEHYRSGARGLVIAIDGPAASGKGTLAVKIAAHFNLPCLDTGLLYRAVARDTAAAGSALDTAAAAVAAAKALDPATLDDPKLRGPAAGDAASVVAKIPQVRAALLEFQRAFARGPGGAVLDGRDIGTVVCPDADVKLFITASAEERARRRHLEHQGRGEAISYEQVLADIRARDARDSGREIAPMGAAADATTIDTTTLDPQAAFAAALEVINQKLKAARTF